MADKDQILPRDSYIDTVYEHAKKDKSILFITADLGAKGLDKYRADLKSQFVHAGISEQNMINLATGLSLSGKKVFTYAMSSFIAFRDFEQIKVTLASLKCPVTILSVGVGYGYDNAGPTHYATEDIGCMRSLANMEILSPADNTSVIESARQSCMNPALRYVRLDRQFLPDIYAPGNTSFWENGIVEIDSGSDVCIVSTGYMTHQARKAKSLLAEQGIRAGIMDVFRIKPFNGEVFKEMTERYNCIVTLEEHFLSAGLGSVVAEACVDYGIMKPVKRIGVVDAYHFENGGREFVHRCAGIDLESIVAKVSDFVRPRKENAFSGTRRLQSASVYTTEQE